MAVIPGTVADSYSRERCHIPSCYLSSPCTYSSALNLANMDLQLVLATVELKLAGMVRL